jgi:4-hydroxythreonine-4-phosphate dehydrogenase
MHSHDDGLITLAVSAGDPQGIGPEITACAAAALVRERSDVRCLIAGPRRILGPLLHATFAGGGHAAHGDHRHGAIAIIDCPFIEAGPPPSRAGGAAALAALDAALLEVLEGRAHALVTAPLAKEAVALVLPGFVGHTDYLAERTGRRALMMLASDRLRVFLTTVHIPLAHVAERVTRARVAETIADARDGLRELFGFERPRLAVLALNPHAGEGGALGREEIERIAPAIAAAGGPAAGVEGPFSADSFFTPGLFDRFDGVVAMYHDQGLIPLKALGFGRAVNATIGLPFVRTSPDHGTAYALRGTGRAQSASMELALRFALDALARRRA